MAENWKVLSFVLCVLLTFCSLFAELRHQQSAAKCAAVHAQSQEQALSARLAAAEHDVTQLQYELTQEKRIVESLSKAMDSKLLLDVGESLNNESMFQQRVAQNSC